MILLFWYSQTDWSVFLWCACHLNGEYPSKLLAGFHYKIPLSFILQRGIYPKMIPDGLFRAV
jgi:hypothetical protein